MSFDFLFVRLFRVRYFCYYHYMGIHVTKMRENTLREYNLNIAISLLPNCAVFRINQAYLNSADFAYHVYYLWCTCSQTRLYYLAFQYFDLERTPGRLFQKLVVFTSFDILRIYNDDSQLFKEIEQHLSFKAKYSDD